jgi:hypothetical protein
MEQGYSRDTQLHKHSIIFQFLWNPKIHCLSICPSPEPDQSSANHSLILMVSTPLCVAVPSARLASSPIADIHSSSPAFVPWISGHNVLLFLKCLLASRVTLFRLHVLEPPTKRQDSGQGLVTWLQNSATQQ